MDFATRGTQQTVGSADAGNVSPSAGRQKKFERSSLGRWLRAASVVLLLGITVLLVAIAFSLHTGNNDESKYINTGSFQAVDISVGGSSNGDQIYFGNIKALNSNYLVLDNVYYIPTTSSSSNITLEPLVCQVDAPFNRMVVNRASVNWWENLQSSGKVAQAITNYEKSSKTPSCPSSSSSSTSGTGSTSSTGSSTTGTSTPSTGTTGTTSTTP
jgi:hypothetical protein